MSGHKFLSASEAAKLRGCTVENIIRWVMEDHTLSAVLVSSRGHAVAFELRGLELYTVNEEGRVTDQRTGRSAGNLRFEMAEIVRHLAEWAHASAVPPVSELVPAAAPVESTGAVIALGGTVTTWTPERKEAALTMMNKLKGQGIKAFAKDTAAAHGVSAARLREVLKCKPEKTPVKKTKGVWGV